MTRPADPSDIRVIGILQRGPIAKVVRTALGDEGLEVELRHEAGGDDIWRDTRSADAVLVDDSIDPADLTEAVEHGWIHGTAPVFVLAQKLPGRERYIAWLESGAWDVLKIPLESAALALRLRNILQRGPSPRPRSMRRYSLDTLEKVADEVVYLARRSNRQLHCVAVGLDWPREGAGAEDVLERLADETETLVRGSDLIGLGDRGTLLVILPDTDEEGTETFVDRLIPRLEACLAEWGVLASLRAVRVAAAEATSGREILSLAVQRLRATRP